METLENIKTLVPDDNDELYVILSADNEVDSYNKKGMPIAIIQGTNVATKTIEILKKYQKKGVYFSAHYICFINNHYQISNIESYIKFGF